MNISNSANKQSNVPPMVQFSPEMPFHEGWNKVNGLSTLNGNLAINTEQYFERLEDPSWTFVPWDKVMEAWDSLEESNTSALEQTCLNFISQNSEVTFDPAVALGNAERVYSFLFNEERIRKHEDLHRVTPEMLRVLRESSILCALNKVNASGHICNIGPAWYFAQCSELVYSLSASEASQVDELFHGEFFNGPRLRDQVRAHVALGGKLVHGCHGSGHGSGGCVVSYGTDINQMQNELLALRPHFLAMFTTRS
jgi:hypothetical protein